MSKPTLHEIAAMPFPASEQALQKYYGVEPWSDRAGADRKPFQVKITYSWSESETLTYDVVAADRQEAERLAEDLFDKDHRVRGEDIDVDDVEAVEVGS
jgi:hypothetical protein